MTTRIAACFVVVFFIGASLAVAADVNGKWIAKVPTRDGGTRDVTMTFKAEGGTLTGTVGGMGGDAAISDGKIEGDNISFSVKREFHGNAMVFKYKGVVAGDEIKFTQTREGSERPPTQFTAARAK